MGEREREREREGALRKTGQSETRPNKNTAGTGRERIHK